MPEIEEDEGWMIQAGDIVVLADGAYRIDPWIGNARLEYEVEYEVRAMDNNGDSLFLTPHNRTTSDDFIYATEAFEKAN